MESGTREYKSDFARRFYRQGEAVGEVNATRRMIFAVLVARDVELTGRFVATVDGCADLQSLEALVRQAATAESVDELFD